MMPSRLVVRGDQKLAVYCWGDDKADKPVIVLVHGYPDNAMVWRDVAAQLASRYRVVAYDVRGAGRSSCPRQTRDYALSQLVADLRAVIDAVSPERSVHLAAHDWGSIQSWEAVCEWSLQGRIRSFTSMSGPSLDHAGHWIRRRLGSASIADKRMVLRQLAHSWYIFGFQLPVVGAAAWRLLGQQSWPLVLRKIEGVEQPRLNPTQVADGRNGMNLYRANALRRVLKPRQRYTRIPVQLLFPKQDHFMIEEIWQDTTRWTDRLWRIDVDAGHWMLLSSPQSVARRIDDFAAHIDGAAASEELVQAQVA